MRNSYSRSTAERNSPSLDPKREYSVGFVTPARAAITAGAYLLLTRRIVRQHESFFLVRVQSHEVAPTIDVAAEDLHGHRWWTLAELDSTEERIAPPNLADLVRSL